MTLPSPGDLSLEARRFKALSDETRLRVLDLLRAGELCQCELTAALRVPQSLLAFHMRTLKEAGLVTDRRRGRWVHYALRIQAIGDAEAFLQLIRTPRTERRCCEVPA